MSEPYESISLFRNGRAYAGKGEDGGHLTGDFDLVSDAVDDDGNRVIVLKPHDLTEHHERLDRLVSLLTECLDPHSKLFPELLHDALVDYSEKDVERMLRKVESGREKVSTREGCFRLFIGDGRRKNSEEIMLRS